MTYIPKDHWIICERCGGKFRRTGMREHWTGLWLCRQYCWEPRHPQDFVEGVEDIQTVSVARPDTVNAMGTTTLAADASKWAGTVTLASVSGLAEHDPIGITLDTEIIHWSFISDITGVAVTLGDQLSGAAATGNTVHLPSLNNENWT